MHAIRAMTYTGWTAVSQTVKSIASNTANAVKQVVHPIFSRLSTPLSRTLIGTACTLTGLATISGATASGNILLMCMGEAIAIQGRKAILLSLDEGFKRFQSWLPAIESLKQKLNGPTDSLQTIKREILQQLSPLQTTVDFSKIQTSIQAAEDNESLIHELENVNYFIQSNLSIFKKMQFVFDLSFTSANLIAIGRGYRNYGNEQFVF